MTRNKTIPILLSLLLWIGISIATIYIGINIMLMGREFL